MSKIKEMTLDEIKKELGYDFVIVQERSKVKLGSKNRGDIFIGPDGREWLFVKAVDGGVCAITTKFVFEREQFDNDTNNLAEANVLKRLQGKILPEIGEDNVKEMEIDLTTLDGLKDYGTVKTKIGLPTYQFYVDNQDVIAPVLAELDDWAWLANALSTPKRDVQYGTLCVTPQGNVSWYFCNCHYGVLAFCIFDSEILVS